MGYAKDRMIQQEQQGWRFVDDALAACEDCVDEPAFKEWVAQHHVCGLTCTNCGSSSKAVPVNSLFEFIGDKWLRSRYDDAANILPWDGREGGYQGTVLSSTDIVFEHDLFANEKLAETFIRSFGDRELTPIDHKG